MRCRIAGAPLLPPQKRGFLPGPIFRNEHDIFHDKFSYTEEQIARILNLTDREYAELVRQFLSSDHNTKLMENIPDDDIANL